MSKQALREEAERLVREAMERKNLAIKQGKTRIEAKCGKCGLRWEVDPKATDRISLDHDGRLSE